MTLVADSVGGVLFWQQDARDDLARGIDLRIEIRTCRRLVTDGCVYSGERPPSALASIRELGPALGRVVVLDVGYNDAPDGFDAGIDRVMGALVAAGVDRVVWLTLRERRASWAEINDRIREARKRWPQLQLGDWELESRDHDAWFTDGIHMSWVGGAAFASFLRPLVLAACGNECGEGGSMLSGGQRQRLAIARALLAEPPCFIFDEATSALDTLSEQLISEALEHNLGDRTAIFIAHRLSTVKHCDRIFVLQAGALVQAGSYAELVSAPGLFHDLVQGQQLRD